jgi:adenosylhomocysteinase
VDPPVGYGRGAGGVAGGASPRIAWAQRAMPVLGLLAREFASRQPFAGHRIAACLHITPETAVLVGLITAGGGEIHLAASNPLSPQDDIAS